MVTDWLYIDYENLVTTQLRLSKMISRQYIKQAPITALAYSINDEEGVTSPDHDDWRQFLKDCEDLCRDPDWGVVAHNNAYDMRVWRWSPQSNLPYPTTMHCTQEMAQWCWPSLPGGYGLKNLGERFTWLPEKINIDLTDQTNLAEGELFEYAINDVRMCRLLHQHILPLMPAPERRLMEQAALARTMSMKVDRTKVEEAVNAFSALIKENAMLATEILNDEEAEGFGVDESGEVKSVRTERVKRLLLDNLGFDTQTISKKKLNPAKLAQHEDAAKALNHTSEANKSLSHKRRVKVLAGLDEVDLNFMFYAAHTGRWSGRGDGGKGINIHNLPKRNPEIAKPIRQCYRLPDDMVFVRGDAANLEYRMENWILHGAHATALFEADPFADPYIATWVESVGQQIKKKDPERHVAKAEVLGLGYLMGVGTWIGEILKVLADPVTDISERELEVMCERQGWYRAKLPGYVRAQQKKHFASDTVARVAYITRELFLELHPEILETGNWMSDLAHRLNRSINPQRTLDKCMEKDGAIDPARIQFTVEDNGERNVRARCGLWCHPTICWRDFAIRETPFGHRLTTMQAGNKGSRAFTRNIALENITQSTARNAIGLACLRLADRGYPYILNVHDEILLAVPKDKDAVLQAKADMLAVTGPGNDLGYGWAMLIKPGDINVSSSWYEDEDFTGDQWWADLENGCTELLEDLP